MNLKEKSSLLYERAKAEYDAYINEILQWDVKRLIEEAYKITIMTEILSQIQNNEYAEYQLDVLLTFEHPLLVVYDEWMYNEYCISEFMRDTINKVVDEAEMQLVTGNYNPSALSERSRQLIEQYHSQYCQKDVMENDEELDDELCQ